MKPRSLMALAVVVACVAFLGWRWFGRGDARAKPRREMADDVAAFLVKEASALAPAPSVLLVLVPTNAPGGDPFPVQLAWRVRQLAAAQKDGFAAVETAEVPENALLEVDGECVKTEPFLTAIDAHSNAQVVISLVGVPKLTTADWSGRTRPRLVAFTSARVDYWEALPAGVVSLAVVPAVNPDGEAADPALGQAAPFYRILRLR
jgi:hypothetical protein